MLHIHWTHQSTPYHKECNQPCCSSGSHYSLARRQQQLQVKTRKSQLANANYMMLEANTQAEQCDNQQQYCCVSLPLTTMSINLRLNRHGATMKQIDDAVLK